MSNKGVAARSAPGGAARMREVWDDIEAWYKENAPRLYNDLDEGASEEEIEDAERQLGLTLPEDYKASLKIHNGDVYLHDYNYLSLKGALRKWSLMVRLGKEGTFEGREVVGASDGKIQDRWWHEGWIPFAEDGGGNMLYIDMAPGEKGNKGQILQMELDSGPFSTEYKSFLEYMEHYRDALQRGVYEVNSDGMLSEA